MNEYLLTLAVKPRQMWEVIEGAREYQKHLRSIEMAKIVEQEKQHYKEYSLEDL